jgi:hypothetical protein
MMGRNCMIKLILVMIELIIIVTLEVHANDPTPFSSASTPLPTNLHPFHLENEDITYIHRCVERTTKKFESSKVMIEYTVAEELLDCLFKDPMHPKDYPILFAPALRNLVLFPLYDRLENLWHQSCSMYSRLL